MTDIRQYKDYRLFLKDRFEEIQKKRPKFTYAHCARLLKTSRGYLQLLFARKRNMDINKVGAVAKLFEISALDSEYFVFLYLENTVNDVFVRKYVRFVLTSIRKSSFADLELDPKFFHNRDQNHTSDWATHLVHAFQELEDFKPDADWILSRSYDKTLSRELVQNALDKLRPQSKPHKIVAKKNESTRTGMQIFKAAAVKSMQAVDGIPDFVPYRHFFYSLAIDSKDADQLKAAANEFESRVVAICNQAKHPDKVMAIYTSLFGLSNDPTSTES